jgi:PAS domain S-box-containing protein
MLGLEQGRLVGSSFSEFFHPDDRARVAARIPGEVRMIAREHAPCVVDVASHELQFEGRPRQVVVVHDLTERMARERELLEAQRVAGAGSFSLDERTREVVLSEEVSRICGRDPRDQVELGSNIWAGKPIFDPETYRRFLDAMNQGLSGGQPFEMEVELLRPDGTPRTVLVRAEPVRDRDGAVGGLRGTVLDITERKASERALREASRAKDDFLALLGHELRNPLAPIVTALQILKLRNDPRDAKTLQIVERQVQHLIRLVNDLLDVSRITRGQIVIRRKRVRLRDMVTRGVEMAMPLVEQRGHHLEIRLPGPDLSLDGDEERLAQVIANLLTNAAKYTDPGGHIVIEGQSDDHTIILRVTDDGIGISAELLPHVFDLFTQNQQAADRALGGLGIGLTIVKSLVEMHGGTASAASTGPGHGSVFTIRLPRAEEVVPLDLTPGPPPVEHAPRRILVVDDNEDALELLSEVLRGVGHEVRTAADGPSALEVARTFPAEVAILDIGLPVMDGYELAGRLRDELGAHAPRLIALTGYGQDSDRARATEAGFAEHLTKPVEAERLLRTIDEAA